MGKVVKTIAVIAIAVAVAYFAPQLSAMLVSTLGATGFAAAAITAATTVALTAAAAAASKALGLTPKPGVPGSRGGTPSVFRQSISESFIVYGKRRVGGLLVFYHPRKVGKQHYRYYVIAVAGHRCKGVVDWMLNDQVVTVNSSTGEVTSGVYAGNAWLWFQRGLATETANATFVSECGGKWTAAHRGDGTAAIYAKFKMTDDVVQAGMPNITCIVEGRDEIEDPRDASVGYQNNAVLVFYDWMKIPREEGGFGAYDDEIPDDDYISAQANVCDETVDGEARYAIDGVIVTGAPPSDIRETLVINCAGSFTYSGGKFLMRPGYYVPVSEVLSEADLAGPISVNRFLAGNETANRVEGTFIDPANAYQGMPFGAQSLPGAADIRQMDLDLGFVTSKKRAERIAHIMLKRAEAEITVTWPMNIMGLKVQALDTVQLDTTRYGLSNYAFTVAEWGLSPDYNVVLSLREESPEIYDPPVTVAATPAPTIAEPEQITTDAEFTNLVSTSFTTDADPADGLLQATDTQITVEAHTRTYSDKAVSVDTGTITGLTAETTYHVYYDDDARAGGAVTFVATTTAQDAATTPTNSSRHYVGTITTDVTGGTGTSAGGSSPPGWGGGTYHSSA